MRSLFALLVLLLISLYIRAQENLVLNPGFEEYDDCPDDSGQFAFTVSEWTTYFANPEYINCGYVVYETSLEYPKSGDGFAGAYLYFPTATPNYYFREYLHGQLLEPLEADSNYYVEFYVRPNSRSGFIDRIELAFSQSPLDSLMPTNGVLDVTPSVAYQDGILFETDDYVKVSGCITASGGEQFITLGNFNRDEATQFVQAPDVFGRDSYIYFDDIGVYRFSFDHLLVFDTTICAGSCIDINNVIDGDYQWSFAGGSPVNSEEIAPQQICYDEAGVFDIEVIIEHCLGQDTLLLENAVTVLEQPGIIADTLQSYNLQQGDSLQLEACAEGDSYMWTPSVGLSCSDCPNPITYTNEAIDYTLEISNGSTCVQICNYQITVFPAPDARFSLSADTICAGDCIAVAYTGTTGDVSYLQWRFPGSDISNFDGVAPPELCYEESGIYELELQIGNAVDTNVVIQSVVVLDQPIIRSTGSQQINASFGDTLRLEACAEGQTYRWQSNTPLSCQDCPNPMLIATANETIALEVSTDGYCTVMCSYQLNLSVPENIYIPNVFSPNDDGRNDFFEAYGPFQQIRSLKIFDRWGGLIYEEQGTNARWDGKSGGEPLGTGVYVYLIQYIDIRTGEERQKAGEVLLLK